jgi:uncharacterized protein (UPF0332 family)
MSVVLSLLGKAQENIDAAELLSDKEHYEIAASRAYYAMFYIAQALLHTKGLAFSSHSAVIAAYGKEFAKTNILLPDYHRFLLEAFETRQVSDYDIEIEVSEARAIEVVERARAFLDAANAYVASL